MGIVGVIDYQMGNIQSVVNALTYIEESAVIVKTAHELSQVDRIILPGVGAFGVGIENLKKQGIVEALNREVLEKKKPFLGICLGMQLICKESFEFGHFLGLGWIDASVRKFEKELKVRIPHVGWNNLTIKKLNELIQKNTKELDVYFVHSYYVDANDPDVVIATCEYGREFAAVLEKGNIFATQFHPEKSQAIGLQILRNFSKININA